MNATSFQIMASGGVVCTGRSFIEPKAEEDAIQLTIRDLCHDSNFRLTAKVKYRIEILKPKTLADSDWTDGGVPVGPRGVSSWSIGWKKFLELPLRRRLTEPWFAVVARVGSTGSEEYVLTTGTNEITPVRSGTLYFFVNDAVIGFPDWYDYFYRDNAGTAQIKVTRVGSPEPVTPAAVSPPLPPAAPAAPVTPDAPTPPVAPN